MTTVRTLILIGLVLFGLEDLGHAQIYRQHEFHIAPSSLYVNEHVPEPILYYYSNEAGHLFRTRANDIDVFTTSLFPMGEVRSYAFKTPAVGWVCGNNGVLSTRDSGMTWQQIDTLCLPGADWQQVYLAKFTDLVFALSSTLGLWSSQDEGRTWTKVMDGAYGGIVFHGNMGVLLSSDTGLSFYSTDGGRSWDTSAVKQRGGKPCYDAKHARFTAADPVDSSIYVSSDGDSWQKLIRLPALLFGDVFSDCERVYVPGRQAGIDGYIYGELDAQLGFAKCSRLGYLAYCFSRNQFYFYYSNTEPNKHFLGAARYSKTLDVHLLNDLNFTVPRCSTLTKNITIGISPIESGTANIVIRPVQSSPYITLVSDPTGMTASTISFQFSISGDVKPQKAVYVIEAERCGVRSLYVTIYTNPTTNATELVAKNVNFGRVGTCNRITKWLQIHNPDCDSMQVQTADVTVQSEHFRVLPGQLPLKIAPYAKDSILVEFDPEKAGALAGVVDLGYRTFDRERRIVAYLNGIGSSGASATMLHDTLAFQKVSTCSTASSMTGVQNTGCERVQVESVRLRANSRFEILSAPIGQWMESDSSLPIRLTAKTDAPGTFGEDMEVVLVAENGTRVTLFVALLAEVLPAIKDYSLTSAKNIPGLTTCNSIDTIIAIKNLSTCDILTISGLQVSHPAVQILNATLPIVLQPQQGTDIRLRLTGAGQTTIADQLEITTDLFGLLETEVDARVATPVLTAISLSQPVDDFTTTQCKPITRSYSITTTGCGYLPLKDVRLESAGATRFTLHDLSVALPTHLIESNEIEFELSYDPELTGSDDAAIVIESETGELRRVPVRGQTVDTRMSLSIDMNVSPLTPLTTDQELRVDIIANNAVDASFGLRSIQTELLYFTDLFSITGSEAHSNADLDLTAIAGGFALEVHSSTGMEFQAGDVLATIRLSPRVTSQTFTEFTLRGLTLNESDPEFNRCSISAAGADETTTASVVLDCIGRILSEGLRDERAVTIESIHPQPASVNDRVTLTISSPGVESHVRVVDLLGRELWRTSSLDRTLILPNLPSGLHLLIVRSALGISSRPIIIQ